MEKNKSTPRLAKNIDMELGFKWIQHILPYKRTKHAFGKFLARVNNLNCVGKETRSGTFKRNICGLASGYSHGKSAKDHIRGANLDFSLFNASIDYNIVIVSKRSLGDN